jgi:hypothetical protein
MKGAKAGVDSPQMERHQSVRLSIVDQALSDIVERLAELPLTPRVRELRIRATAFEKRVSAWEKTPPSEEERAEVMRCVLELSVEVMESSREK